MVYCASISTPFPAAGLTSLTDSWAGRETVSTRLSNSYWCFLTASDTCRWWFISNVHTAAEYRSAQHTPVRRSWDHRSPAGLLSRRDKRPSPSALVWQDPHLLSCVYSAGRRCSPHQRHHGTEGCLPHWWRPEAPCVSPTNVKVHYWHTHTHTQTQR